MTPIEIGDVVYDGLAVAEVIGEGTLALGEEKFWKVKILTGHQVGAESIMFKDSDRLRVVGKGQKSMGIKVGFIVGREIRMVPADWEHPKDDRGQYRALFDGYGYQDAHDEFMAKLNAEGLQAAIEWYGQAPNRDDYMLVGVPESERTHYMMYEDVSEGTPISPAFATPEELARWLTDTGANYFAYQTATYVEWLNICKGGISVRGLP